MIKVYEDKRYHDLKWLVIENRLMFGNDRMPGQLFLFQSLLLPIAVIRWMANPEPIVLCVFLRGLCASAAKFCASIAGPGWPSIGSLVGLALETTAEARSPQRKTQRTPGGQRHREAR